MIGRRLAALAGVLGLVLAALVLPAAAQTAPPPTIDRFFPRCLDLNDGSDIVVEGQSSARSVSVLLISPSGTVIDKAAYTPASGRYGGSPFAVSPSETGSYEVRVSDSFGTVSAYFEVPCQAPSLEYEPSCFARGYRGTVTMVGRHFFAWDQPHTVVYDVNGAEQQVAIRRVSDGRGVVRFTFNVAPTNRPYPGEITQAQQGLAARATWAPCPPGTVPTTTTSTTSTSTTAPPDDEPIPTTTRPTVPGSIPTTTLPATIDIPPPTPGATLVVTPALGPTGFVAGAVGTGFPPGPVELTWSGGIGTTMTIAGPDGTFSTRVLVLPGDRLGPRALVATGGGTSTFAAFLVVPSTVQPSGSDVNQINRIRRFNNR